MNITEVLFTANITHDDKARRVLNTAPDKMAGINLDEIEAGITIERLESLTVPVYQYGTQITIHGIFNNIPDDLRIHGYKSVILNQNKSLGVKYAAIDGQKKKLLEQARDHGSKQWAVIIDSQGCEIHKIFHSDNPVTDKMACIECYLNTPDDLYIGSKKVVALMFGGYAVVINIGAIYERNLWPLIETLTGVKDQTELDIKIRLKNEEYERKHLEYMAEVEREKIARDNLIQESYAKFTAPDNWVPFNGNIKNPGIYAKISTSFMNNAPALFVYKVKKFGTKFKISSKKFIDFNFIDWLPGKYSIYESKLIDNGWIIN